LVPYSVHDLVSIVAGSNAADAFRRAVDLAQHAEAWGYRRHWFAEHHNMEGVASSATTVVMAHVAGKTKTIRIGSGGIMLPNHSPLVIAEQFGTLAEMFPGRIDLGVGRAPGTDRMTSLALRRDVDAAAGRFPQDVVELRAWLAPAEPNQAVKAIPGAGTKVPIWMLGSSLFGAQLAAMLGLPYSFASHFAPDALLPAARIYREKFEPSEELDRPYFMPALHVTAADTDAEAERLHTSVQQAILNIIRNTRGPLPAPVDRMEWTQAEEAHAKHMLQYSVVGGPERVAKGLRDFIELTEADEIMVAGLIHDHRARLRSFEIVADVMKAMKPQKAAAQA
jgi:luciferase family oxidoreductase group 1